MPAKARENVGREAGRAERGDQHDRHQIVSGMHEARTVPDEKSGAMNGNVTAHEERVQDA